MITPDVAIRTRRELPITRFIRSGTTAGVHVWGCPYAGNAWVPWMWAEGRDVSEWANLPWLKPCGHCRPTSNQDTKGDA